MPPKGSGKRKSQGGTPTAAKKANVSINSSSSVGASHRLVEKIRTVSQPEMVELSYEYTIPDLSLLSQKIGEHIEIPAFKSKSHSDIMWCLWIYPNDNSEKSKGSLSVFLERICKEEDEEKCVPCYFKVCVLQNGVEIVDQLYHLFQSKTSNWGWLKFCSLDQLKSEGNQIGNDNHYLKIVCSLVFEAKRNWLTNLDRTVENVSSSFGNRRLNYDWTIEEPAFLPQKNGESFYSPIFSAKANDKIRWRLKMCPKGANEESKDHLSLFLERFTGRIEQSVTVKSNWLVTKNGKVIFSKSNELQTLGNAPLPSNFGWDKVAPLASIERASFDTFPGIDELKVSCQLVYTI